jgi:hypothetical protein
MPPVFVFRTRSNWVNTPVVALRIIAGEGRSGMNPEVLSGP